MTVNCERREDEFVIFLEGELDHHAARVALEQAGRLIEEYVPLSCLLDLSRLGFMDSSGIAVILGLDRRLQSYGGKLRVQNIPRQPARVLQTAGVGNLVALDV